MTLNQFALNNANYWLGYLQSEPENSLITGADLRGAAEAIASVLVTPGAWALTKSLALVLHPHMEQQGYWTEWDDFLHSVVARARHEADYAAESKLLTRQGTIQRQRGNYKEALRTCRRSWWLCRQKGEPGDRAQVLSSLGDLYRLLGCFRRAEMLCQAVIAWFEALGDESELAHAQNRLGLVYFDQERWVEALHHLLRAEILYGRVNDLHGQAKVLHNVGELHRNINDLEKALACFQQAIDYYQQVGDEAHIARVQINIGNVCLQQSNLHQAQIVYTQAEARLKRIGDRLDLAVVHHNLGIVYTGLGCWEEATACFERALEQWRSREDTLTQANTLGEFACMCFASGREAQAQARLEEAWQLVQGQSGVRAEIIRRELAALWLKLFQKTMD